MKAGEVKVLSSTATTARIHAHGKHSDRYIERVRQNLGESTADKTRETAIDVISKCVQTYDEVFATGEVGVDGSASVKQPTGGTKCPCIEGATSSPLELPDSTGLLYGKVQSGKTNASMATVTLGLDNGFRVFVVLTSDNTLLGEQTHDRFTEEILGGPVIYQQWDWEADPDAFGKTLKDEERLSDTGVVLISTKNTHHLKKLCRVLWFAGARYFPGLLLDDEADNASLDTNASKEDAEPGAIFSRIGQIRKAMGNHIYLQVTATPQSLFLQAVNHPCKPKFCARLPPGDEYVGGTQFFADDSQLRCEISDDELEALRTAKKGKTEAPEGLRLALATFLVGCAERHSDKKDDNLDRFAFLAHVDMRQLKHEELSRVIDAYIVEISRALRGKESDAKKRETSHMLRKAWEELKKTRPTIRPLDSLLEYIEQRSGNLRTVIVNADNKKGDTKKLALRAGPNIFVGGNRLGRGLTIPNLIVTYYGRDAKTKMMDVVHQHARMFGYRKKLLDVTRLFSTASILRSFKSIHEADEAMRRALGDDPTRIDLHPVWVGPEMRPTRANILDPNQLGVMVPGRPHYPWTPVYEKKLVRQHTEWIDKFVAENQIPQKTYVPLPLAVIKTILSHLPAVAHEGHAWTDERIQLVIDALMAKGHGLTHGDLNVTSEYSHPRGGRVNRARGDEPTDFLETSTLSQANPAHLSLILRRQHGEKKEGWDDQPFWAPTVLLPAKPQPFVFMYNLVARS